MGIFKREVNVRVMLSDRKLQLILLVFSSRFIFRSTAIKENFERTPGLRRVFYGLTTHENENDTQLEITPENVYEFKELFMYDVEPQDGGNFDKIKRGLRKSKKLKLKKESKSKKDSNTTKDSKSKKDSKSISIAKSKKDVTTKSKTLSKQKIKSKKKEKIEESNIWEEILSMNYDVSFFNSCKKKEGILFLVEQSLSRHELICYFMLAREATRMLKCQHAGK